VKCVLCLNVKVLTSWKTSIRPGFPGMFVDEIGLVGWLGRYEVTGKPRGVWG